MVFKLPWGKKQMFWALENGIFHYYANFSTTNLKPFSSKNGKSFENLFKQKFIMKSVSENRFGATLTSKGNVLSILKVTFFTFFKFSCDEVKIIFWESKAKLSSLFKSKVCHGYRFRKQFRSYFEVQNEVQIFWFF